MPARAFGPIDLFIPRQLFCAFSKSRKSVKVAVCTAVVGHLAYCHIIYGKLLLGNHCGLLNSVISVC